MNLRLDRRSFLGVAAAAPFVPRMALAAEPADVVIIGGGLSGLAAAITLGDLGLKAVVLEAGQQVGGRVKTVATADGGIDVGASQIGRGYARTIAMCRRLGLELIPEDRDLLTFGFHYRDSWIDPAQWAAHPLNDLVGEEERALSPLTLGQAVMARTNPLQNLDDWLDPRFAQHDISLRQLMQQNGYSPQAIELARLSVPGIGMDQTSMLRMWQEDLRGQLDRRINNEQQAQAAQHARDHPFGEANDPRLVNGLAMISNVAGGCQRLPLAMAATLGDAVRLDAAVVSIAMDGRGALVTCRDGRSWQAPFVISALPFTMLREVQISGTENPVARQAIAEMPYANTARAYLQVERPFWQDDGLPASFATDGPMGMFWGIDNHTGTGAHRAMVVMVGQVAAAIARHDTAAAEGLIMEELARLRPASQGLVRLVTYKDWARDPLQRGCGFSLAPGQVNAFAREMVQPWQALHFAGEHTRRLDYGMESAFESGERAAFEIFGRMGT